MSVDLADLESEFHPEKNVLQFSSLTRGSRRKVWWICPKGHEWVAEPCSRVGKGSGCPACSGRVPWPGETDLATTHPYLAAEFSLEKNDPLTPTDVKAGSAKKVWWVCSEGHEWEQRVARRSAGAGCPVCCGQRVGAGFNDLASLHPEIAAGLHPSRNGATEASTLHVHSEKRVWWACPLGHEWRATVYSRTVAGTGCPHCSGNTVLQGFNDLATTHPHLTQEFDRVLNRTLSPETISAGSGKKVWWICELQHSWQATVNSRAGNSRRGCPFCSGNRVLAGFNDLASTHPDLSLEWDSFRNSTTSSEVSYGSHKKVWWLCPRGHSWEAVIKNRVGGAGCPKCIPDSVPEAALRELLGGEKARVPISMNRFKTKEVDILLKDLRAVVEYDGWYYHKDTEAKDIRHTDGLIDQGFRVVRIREHPLALLPETTGLYQVSFRHLHDSYACLADSIRNILDQSSRFDRIVSELSERL